MLSASSKTDKVQLVDLMHGAITLDSTLGSGTTAEFWIPFNKPQYRSGASPLIEIGSLPDRLRSELSVSGCGSDQDLMNSTPPPTPHDPTAGPGPNLPNNPRARGIETPPLGAGSDPETTISVADRKKMHVLVVEDK